MFPAPPSGITPPAPGLEREEPEFMTEDDIPSDDGRSRERSHAREERTGGREERSHGKIERE